MSKYIIIHFVNWNSEDVAYKFPRERINELRAAAITSSNWFEFFIANAIKTKGIEDAEYFLDYINPVESASEWE